jgi:hypothetical protein
MYLRHWRFARLRYELGKIKGEDYDSYYDDSPERIPDGGYGEVCHAKKCLYLL